MYTSWVVAIPNLETQSGGPAIDPDTWRVHKVHKKHFQSCQAGGLVAKAADRAAALGWLHSDLGDAKSGKGCSHLASSGWMISQSGTVSHACIINLLEHYGAMIGEKPAVKIVTNEPVEFEK